MINFSGDTQQAINCAVNIMRESRYTTVLTGAGISTPSGIPDFRSSTSGLWSKYDPFEVASLTSFRYHPDKFFSWMRPLAQKMHDAAPNAAHTGLADLEQAGYVESIITQNIDSLHTRAGSKNVIEIHGSMTTMTCMNCFNRVVSEEYTKPYLEEGEIPHCQKCSGVLKPDVILMQEQLPAKAWQRAVKACQRCDVLLIIGSSLEVVPVANLPMQAVDHGAHLIIVNKTSTYIDIRADVVIHQDLIDVIPAIVSGLLGRNYRDPFLPN